MNPLMNMRVTRKNDQTHTLTFRMETVGCPNKLYPEPKKKIVTVSIAISR